MQINLIILVIVSQLFSLGLNAQKMKYKDLYPSLAAKEYSSGIPRLKKYLEIEENKSEANANLQMGLWLHNRFMKMDDTGTNRFNEVRDSALFFLEKAMTLIDKKEVKKNDKYYQEFLRRDLRSGKFLVKVSDIHLDIENKVQEIKERQE